jgi:rhamnogalacturonyl hydrolase YesR
MAYLSLALAETILTRYPDPDQIPWRAWCYMQGYILAGLEKLATTTDEQRYWDYILRFADAHAQPDVAVRGFKGNSLDDIMAGATLAAAYAHTGAERYRRAAATVRAAFGDYPRNSDGGFWHGRELPHEMWIDGVFMGGMFLSRYGAATGDRASLDEAAQQILILAARCRKGTSGLFYHAWDEARRAPWADAQTGLSPEVWSEGLGWYALILVETLPLLPVDHPDRAAILAILRELAEGLRRVQDARSGLWYQVVDKGERPDNWCDTSGSAMFVYMLRRGCDLGYLDEATYAPVAARGYAGVLSKARPNAEGLIDIYDACDGVCVQKSYADYVHYPRKVNAKEAVGGVLWAATVMEKPGRCV